MDATVEKTFELTPLLDAAAAASLPPGPILDARLCDDGRTVCFVCEREVYACRVTRADEPRVRHRC